MKREIVMMLAFVLVAAGFVLADTNGIWHRAEDISAGTFGGDEGGGVYTFSSGSSVNVESGASINVESLVYQGSELSTLLGGTGSTYIAHSYFDCSGGVCSHDLSPVNIGVGIARGLNTGHILYSGGTQLVGCGDIDIACLESFIMSVE